MTFTELIYFEAIVRLGSFKAAARSVYISQQALSAAMKKLEREVGVPLLRRSAFGSVPTPEGQELYSVAKEVISCLDRLKNVSNAEAGQRIDILYLSFFVFHEILLYKTKRQFEKIFPGVAVHITPVSSLAGVRLQDYTFVCCHSSSKLGCGRSWRHVLRSFDRDVFANDQYCLIVQEGAVERRPSASIQHLLTLNSPDLPQGFLEHLEAAGWSFSGSVDNKKTLESILAQVSVDAASAACISHIALRRYQQSLNGFEVISFPILPMSEHLILRNRGRVDGNAQAERFLELFQENCSR